MIRLRRAPAARVTEWTLGTLKEHVEVQVNGLQELLEQRLGAMDVALGLKSEELSRRLDILNHAHERAVEVQHTYVPREVFEASTDALAKAVEEKAAALAKQFDDYKMTTNRALTLKEGQSAGLNAGWVYLLATIAAIGTLVSIYLAVSGK